MNYLLLSCKCSNSNEDLATISGKLNCCQTRSGEEIMKKDVILTIERNMAEIGTDKERMTQYHQERARLLHGLADTLSLDVKDWGLTDTTGERIPETSELQLVLADAAVIQAAAAVIGVWLQFRQLRSVEVKRNDRTTVKKFPAGNIPTTDIEAALNDAQK
jgi:hypothetical protein